MTHKKILIVTHRPRTNYGGIAQAYALQRIFRDRGHRVESTFSPGSPYKKYIATNVVLRKILRKPPVPDNSEISRLTQIFVDKDIKLIPLKVAKKKSRQHAYDLFVVGSDQVWRAKYSYLPDYMFAFVRSMKAPRISYAASFGKDDLNEFNSALLKKTRKLASKFDAISVRESSGVDLVKKFWGRTAVHHIDPTLLLDDTVYEEVIEKSSTPLENLTEGKLFSYVLDPSLKSDAVISKVSRILDLQSTSLIDEDLNDGRVLPPFEQWLKSFRDANFVVTDSFHGTVFAIIFRKSFLTLANQDRGLARFTSLLSLLGLENRLLTDRDEVNDDLIKEDIDWQRVSNKLRFEKAKSISFLEEYL